MDLAGLGRLLEALPIAALCKAPDGTIVAANRALAGLAGLAEPSAVVGQSERALPWGAASAPREASFLDATGRARRVRLREAPLHDDAGRVAGAVVTIEDLGEVRQPQTPDRVQRILDSLPYPFFAKDARLLYTDCNRAFERFLGKTRDEIIGKSVFEVSEGALAEVYHQADLLLMDRGGAQTYESKVRYADGNIRDVVFHKGVVEDAAGRPTGIVGIYVDVTERKRMEAALREAERNYRLLVDHSLAGIYIIQGPVLTTCNQRFAEIFGWASPAEIVGKDIAGLIAPEDRARVAEEIRLRETDRKLTSHYSFTGRRRDGSRIEVEVLGSRIEFEGRPAVQGTLVDVSERRRLAEERRRLDERLQRAQRMETVGQLAGGMAHDLNNLLLPILGYASLLAKALPPGEDADHVAQIVAAAERARDLVWRLMAFGRKQVLELKPVDLRSVVAGFEKMLRGTLRDDVKLVLSLPPELPAVQADVAQLEQVVMNLAVNAQDAMKAGGRFSIRLSEVAGATVPGAAAGRCVLVEVEDTGCGMDAAVRARLFEPFFTTKPVGQGTGLGLSTVYGIVQQHGGQILVDSEVGRGSTFRIYLPGLAQGHAPSPKAPPPTEPAPGSGEVVLLVEDNEMVRRTTAKILELGGYRVVAAESGERALKLAAELTRIDLLLTDVIMPGMNGRELHAKLRAEHPALRAVFMSGHDWNVVSEHGVLETGVLFLQKPFLPDALAEKVRQALSRGEKPAAR